MSNTESGRYNYYSVFAIVCSLSAVAMINLNV